MADFLFVVKTFIFTVVLVVLMQIKIGEATIEEHSHVWIQESAIHRTLGKVAYGAVVVMKDGANYVRQLMAGETNSNTQQANR